MSLPDAAEINLILSTAKAIVGEMGADEIKDAIQEISTTISGFGALAADNPDIAIVAVVAATTVGILATPYLTGAAIGTAAITTLIVEGMVPFGILTEGQLIALVQPIVSSTMSVITNVVVGQSISAGVKNVVNTIGSDINAGDS